MKKRKLLASLTKMPSYDFLRNVKRTRIFQTALPATSRLAAVLAFYNVQPTTEAE